MSDILIGIVILVSTFSIYVVMTQVYRRFKWPVLIPGLTATVIIIAILLVFQISYETYMMGGQWINHLLGPAVVSLAIPLYRQRAVLVKNLIPVLGSVFIGSVAGILSGLIFANMLGISKSLIVSIVPKSITTPVAMQIATELGGIPSLAAVFVMIAGFTGAVFGVHMLKLFRIVSPLGRGIALGSASHAIGTSKAFEYGEQALSFSSLAMTLSAIFGSVLGPVLVWLFY
jgi:predicted murein hydrolase (TIGR00659 family)